MARVNQRIKPLNRINAVIALHIPIFSPAIFAFDIDIDIDIDKQATRHNLTEQTIEEMVK